MTPKTTRIVRRAAVALGTVLALAGLFGALIYTGTLWPTQFTAGRFPLKGVDVSEYQGTVDWEAIKNQGIEFAFLKATEGSSYIDSKYETNAQGAAQAGVKQGAYHFFSFDSPGKTQAQNFLQVIGEREQPLPAAVDVELYGRHKQSPPKREDVQRELTVLIDAVQEQTGNFPILYATGEAYDRYLAGSFPNCPIWIRDVLKTPRLSDGRKPLFWQYSPRGRLKGLSGGEEPYIDLNVFWGTQEEFDAMLKSWRNP